MEEDLSSGREKKYWANTVIKTFSVGKRYDRPMKGVLRNEVE